MPATDLWPEFTVEKKPRTVRHVLDEAGAGLKEKTGGAVEFRTFRTTSGEKDYPFTYDCTLAVPKLDYNYLLLRVDSSPTGFPVRVTSGYTQYDGLPSEERLVEVLATIFGSEQTRKVIQNLISMATD